MTDKTPTIKRPRNRLTRMVWKSVPAHHAGAITANLMCMVVADDKLNKKSGTPTEQGAIALNNWLHHGHDLCMRKASAVVMRRWVKVYILDSTTMEHLHKAARQVIANLDSVIKECERLCYL